MGGYNLSPSFRDVLHFKELNPVRENVLSAPYEADKESVQEVRVPEPTFSLMLFKNMIFEILVKSHPYTASWTYPTPMCLWIMVPRASWLQKYGFGAKIPLFREVKS